MGRPDNRLQLMDRLGAKQANTVWAWCGVDESNRKVYFSLWTDLMHKDETGKAISSKLRIGALTSTDIAHPQGMTTIKSSIWSLSMSMRHSVTSWRLKT